MLKEKKTILKGLQDAALFDDELTFVDLGGGVFAWRVDGYTGPPIETAGEGPQEYFFAAVDALREMVKAGQLGARRRANNL